LEQLHAASPALYRPGVMQRRIAAKGGVVSRQYPPRDPADRVLRVEGAVKLLAAGVAAPVPPEEVALVQIVNPLFTAERTLADALKAKEVFERYCKRVNIDLSEEKQQYPSTSPLIPWVRVDTVALMASLPLHKAYTYMLLCQVLLACLRRGVRLPGQLLRKLAGQLCAASAVLPGARYRLASLYTAVRDVGDFESSSKGGVSTAQTASAAASSAELAEDLQWHVARLGDPSRHQRLAPLGPGASSATMVRTQSDASGDEDGDCVMQRRESTSDGRSASAVLEPTPAGERLAAL
jgi:hypothetical protein